MKILVTGAAGFIGRHLCNELETACHDVIRTDREPTRGYQVDLLAPGAAHKLITGLQPDVVVHLAAQVGRLFGEDDWRLTIESNAVMTTFVAAATAAAGARLMYASTSEIYGDQGDATCEEDGPQVLPHNLYGLSKRWGEETCQLYAPDGLQVIRPSMPYGPGVPPGRGRRALDNILWQAWTHQRIPIHRGAERSWCWIGDAVRGIRLIIESGEPGAYNVGRDDRPISMLDLAHECVALAGRDDEDLIDLVTPPHAQTVVKRLSTDKLRSLGWAPEVELDEGLPQVFEWVKNYDVNGDWVGA